MLPIGAGFAASVRNDCFRRQAGHWNALFFVGVFCCFIVLLFFRPNLLFKPET